MSRRRQLSGEDEALWQEVARSITPLRGMQDSAEPAEKSFGVAPKAGSASLRGKPRADITPAAPPARPLPLAPLGRRLKQRVARGREPIDVRIDLHGLTQRQAHTALLRFLHDAQVKGARIALVVTGKGSSGAGESDAASERGVLKRQVPLWLALPEFRPLVVGFEDAHVGHGGQGALYVRLRRGR